VDELLMDADFSIELEHEDPVLDFPWKDPSGILAYVDVKRHPELMAQIEEAERFPELKEFLRALNSVRSMVETAKCDTWLTEELNAEEDVYNASHKFASYVDVVFSSGINLTDGGLSSLRQSLTAHEQFARRLVGLLRRAPDMPSAAEICVRRCYYDETDGTREGFCCTLYLSGYGSDKDRARQNWGLALKLTANAIAQLSAGKAL
jgi:hypothetical protein